MAAAQLVSADSPVNEPSDLWLERIEKAFSGVLVWYAAREASWGVTPHAEEPL